MRIMQVSTRLLSGGAAAVARSLDLAYRLAGNETCFVYGYGPRGRREPTAAAHEVAVTWRQQAAASLVVSQLIGVDVSFPGQRRRLVSLFRQADVIQLHVVHSHLASLHVLVDALIEAGRPVVWTHHDQWVLTGRCAIPDECLRFEQSRGGCRGCPQKQAYPPTRVDLSQWGWRRRRRLVDRLSDGVELVFTANCDWVGECLIREFPSIRCVVIRNGADQTFLDASPSVRASAKGVARALVVAADLRDDAKVDQRLLQRLLSSDADLELRLIGRNPPLSGDRIEWAGEVTDRGELVRQYQGCDVLLFMSTTDTVGMVVVEACLAGVPVIMRSSPGTRELGRALALPVYGTDDEFVHAVWSREYLNFDVEACRSAARREFEAAARCGDYLSLYREVLSRGASRLEALRAGEPSVEDGSKRS